jgi:hypothetical protein
MQQVWKYELSIHKLQPNDLITIQLPVGADILTVHEQHGSICLWALVNTNATKIERTFRIAGTGHNLANGNFKYIGTAFLEDGALVFHVFECK